MYNLRKDVHSFFSWTAYCEMTPLRETLTALCDFEQLNDDKHMGFGVTATDVASGDSKRFLNLKLNPELRSEPELSSTPNLKYEPITPDHIIASGALPPGFPMTMIDGRSYWDGGVFDNTPMAPMLELLERQQRRNVPVIVIELFPAEEEQPLPMDMLQLKNRMMELTYQNRFWDDYGGLESLRDYAAMITDLGDELPSGSRIRKNVQFDALMKRRFFRNLHVIQSSHVPMTGAMDFSERSIMARHKRGYDAADRIIEKLDTAQPSTHPSSIRPSAAATSIRSTQSAGEPENPNVPPERTNTSQVAQQHD
jgi:NTE family protein